jgi:hypothetical protein
MTKVANYYLGLTGDKNIVYDNLHTKEKYSDVLQMFRDILKNSALDVNILINKII